MLIQRSISHLIARIYVHLVLLAAHKGMQKKEVIVMINQRINCCLTFSQGKCPHLTMMKRICLFPQILNIIDTELAKTNCLDCNKYIDRRVLSTKSTLEGKMLQERRTTMASENERNQHVRIKFKLPTSMVSLRSVMWRAKRSK
jgi:hypothetical protein